MEIEQLLKSNKIVDSKTYQVDSKFKSELKAQLFEQYINSKEKNTMNRLLGIFKNRIFLGAIASLSLITVGVLGYLLLNNTKLINTDIKGSVALAQGTASFKRDNQSEWSTLNTGDLIEEGYNIRTGEGSRVVIELDNGDAIRLDANTQVLYADASAESIKFELAEGNIYNRVVKSDTNHYTVTAGEVKGVALGTAFSFEYKPEKYAKIFTFESTVEMDYKDSKNKIETFKKGVIEFDKEESEIKVESFEESDVKTEFVEWNKTEDEKSGKTTWEGNKPTVSIISPANGTATTSSPILLTGKASDDSGLKKIVVNGNIFTSMNADGTGFNPTTGDFKINVSLKEGENTIEVKAYDTYWNTSEVATTKVVKSTPITPTPTKTPEATEAFYISSISSPAAGKITVKWYVKGYDVSNGFKVVRGPSTNPVYPGNDAAYNGSEVRQYTWTGLAAGTYHVRVCIYNGAGACTKYTADKSVTVAGVSTGDASIPSLTATFVAPDKVKLSWTVNGTWDDGFKVVWSESANPTYPGAGVYHYYSNSDQRIDTVSGLESGKTYNFRVCLYNGSCASSDYSPNKTVTIP